MTREARLTQKRLEGEILKLLEGNCASLYHVDCAFCLKYEDSCSRCPLKLGNRDLGCARRRGYFRGISESMIIGDPNAIPGALAIHMWLFDL